MSIPYNIINRKKQLEAEISRLSDEVSAMPSGTLQIRKNGKYHKCFRSIPPTSQFIKKADYALVKTLFIKKYKQMQLNDLQQELSAIDTYEKMLERGSDNVREFLNANKSYSELINCLVPTDISEIRQWENAEYPRNPRFQERLTIQTRRGEFVRSKSEALIANELYSYHIPYRYECELQLGESIIYPDFTILDFINKRIIIWEHFGLMKDPTYIRASASKLSSYLMYGYLPNQNLITTFETDENPLGCQLIDSLIEIIIKPSPVLFALESDNLLQ